MSYTLSDEDVTFIRSELISVLDQLAEMRAIGAAMAATLDSMRENVLASQEIAQAMRDKLDRLRQEVAALDEE